MLGWVTISNKFMVFAIVDDVELKKIIVKFLCNSVKTLQRL